MTPQVPIEVRRLAEARGIGDFKRGCAERAQTAMSKLGISSNSELFVFCSSYCLGNLFSKTAYEALVDVCEPSEEVAAGTRFIHEVWELPSEYICLTSCQGEGAYLYSNETQEIYDFSLEYREEFLRRPRATWRSFYEFLRWYLCEPSDA